MRIAIAEIGQETDTFSSLPTTLELFEGHGLYFGDDDAGCCHTGIFVRTGGHVVRGNVVSGNWLGIRTGDTGTIAHTTAQTGTRG